MCFSSREFIRWAVALMLLCASSLHAQARFEYSEVAMGVRARIVLYAEDEPTARTAARAAYDRIAVLEDIMSDYRPDSEVSRLSANAGGPAMQVSPELACILTKSQELARRSDGAFDVTVGPITKLWRTTRKSGKLPAEADLAAARKLVGWRKLHIGCDILNPPVLSSPDSQITLASSCPPALSGPQAVSKGGKVSTEPRSAYLDTPGMLLDLGGIAKGYACDEAIRVLKLHGIPSALVEMGGDIVVSDAPPGTKGWEIEIANALDPAHKALTLFDAAISSSGDTEQFVEIEGKRYSHIANPRTGLGLTERIAVTVIAPNGITSDSLSTAISVLGEKRGKTLANTFPGVRVYIRKPVE